MATNLAIDDRLINEARQIGHHATKKAAVIDPGGEVPKILEAIKQTKVTVEKIWLTHGHIDHVGGAGLGQAVPRGIRSQTHWCC